MNDTYSLATDYKSRGWFPFSLRPRGKRPLNAGWQSVQPTDANLAWQFQKNPDNNIGIDCERSGLVVLDEDADGALESWLAKNDLTLPETYTVATANGRHLYFKAHPEFETRSQIRRDGDPIDVRAIGGLVVAAGSTHETGHVYAVINDVAPVQLPTDVARVLAVTKQTKLDDRNAEDKFLNIDGPGDPNTRPIPVGQRDSELFSYACHLRKIGIDKHEASVLMEARWKLVEQPETYTLSEALQKVENAYSSYTPDPVQSVAPPSYSEAATGVPMIDRFLRLPQLDSIEPPTALIDGLLFENTVAQMSGAPGSFKSFIALGMACAIASGQSDWESYPISQTGRVLYIAAEGSSGLKNRVLGWREMTLNDDESRSKLDQNFAVFPEAVQLSDKQGMAELTAAVKQFRPLLVVIDTRAKSTVGMDENASKEMGLAFAAAERLQIETGATVLVIHHTGKDTSKGGRGSNVWDGGVYSLLTVRRIEKSMNVEIICEKHKDVPDGCRHSFVMKPTTVDNTEVLVATNGRFDVDSFLGFDSEDATVEDRVLALARSAGSIDGLTRAEFLRMLKDDAGRMDSKPPSQTMVYKAVEKLHKAGHLIDCGKRGPSQNAATVYKPETH